MPCRRRQATPVAAPPRGSWDRDRPVAHSSCHLRGTIGHLISARCRVFLGYMRELRTGAGDDGGVVDGSRHCRCATGPVPPEEPRHERPAGVRHRVPGVTGGASENPRGDQFRRNRSSTEHDGRRWRPWAPCSYSRRSAGRSASQRGPAGSLSGRRASSSSRWAAGAPAADDWPDRWCPDSFP